MTARVPIGIVINGVTGRMGYRQHLVRSLLAIREAGGRARGVQLVELGLRSAREGRRIEVPELDR